MSREKKASCSKSFKRHTRWNRSMKDTQSIRLVIARSTWTQAHKHGQLQSSATTASPKPSEYRMASAERLSMSLSCRSRIQNCSRNNSCSHLEASECAEVNSSLISLRASSKSFRCFLCKTRERISLAQQQNDIDIDRRTMITKKKNIYVSISVASNRESSLTFCCCRSQKQTTATQFKFL